MVPQRRVAGRTRWLPATSPAATMVSASGQAARAVASHQTAVTTVLLRCGHAQVQRPSKLLLGGPRGTSTSDHVCSTTACVALLALWVKGSLGRLPHCRHWLLL